MTFRASRTLRESENEWKYGTKGFGLFEALSCPGQSDGVWWWCPSENPLPELHCEVSGWRKVERMPLHACPTCSVAEEATRDQDKKPVLKLNLAVLPERLKCFRNGGTGKGFCLFPQNHLLPASPKYSYKTPVPDSLACKTAVKDWGCSRRICCESNLLDLN